MLRRALIRLREGAQDVYTSVRGDFAPMETLDLHAFSPATDMARYQVTTDAVVGGRSSSAFTLKRYEHFSAGCFTGAIDFAHEDDVEGRGGFASFRTLPDERVRDLSAFEAFELRVKTDGRPYTLNFKCAEHSPEQLWQAQVLTPRPYEWTSVAVPFADLRLTRRGRVELAQVELNRETVNGFGVLLADGRNGPFRFELQYLRALRRVDRGQWQSAAERAFVEAGGGAPRLPAAGGGGQTAAGEAAGEAAGGQPAAPGEAAPGSQPAPHSDAPAAGGLMEPPAPGASREEWQAWYRKAKSAHRMDSAPR